MPRFSRFCRSFSLRGPSKLLTRNCAVSLPGILADERLGRPEFNEVRRDSTADQRCPDDSHAMCDHGAFCGQFLPIADSLVASLRSCTGKYEPFSMANNMDFGVFTRFLRNEE